MTTPANSASAPPDAAPPRRAWHHAARDAAPATFFFGGFIWDTIALGRGFKAWDLWLLLGYLVVSTIVIALLGRGIRPRQERWFNFALQFCFGGTFASLTVLYFTSAASWPSLLFIVLVAVVLVANEYLEHRYGEMTIALTMYALSVVMYLNFAFPVVLRSVRPVWFYVSTAAGLGLTYALRRFATIERVSMKPAAVAAGALAVMFLLNWVPPVPLVKREMAICRDLVRTLPLATAKVEAPPPWWFWKRSEHTVHWRPGERIWCYSSVFAPAGISVRIAHRWYYRDPAQGWVTRARIPVTITGGREDGYRVHSYADHLQPGRWSVTVETESGQVIAVSNFTVVDAAGEPPPALKPVSYR